MARDGGSEAGGAGGAGGADAAAVAGAGGGSVGGNGRAGNSDGGDAGGFDCTGFSAGTVCGAGTCSGAAIVGRYVCDGSGNCVPGPSVACAPFSCSPQTNRCLAGCAGDTDCWPGWVCLAGACSLRSIGNPCTLNTECVSGFCVDGVCCNNACNGACRSCAFPSALGNCTAVWAGAVDPHGFCVAMPVETCGRNGSCDGVGGCANYPAGTACGVAGCRDGTNATAAKCNGVGTCVRSTNSCEPFACDTKGGQCRTTCAGDQDCAAGQPCLNGRCGSKESALCTKDTECTSGICSQGVCCRQRCDGVCQSCALTGSYGELHDDPGIELDPGLLAQPAI